MSLLTVIALSSVAVVFAIALVTMAAAPSRPRRGRARPGAGPVVLPVVRAVPRIDEFTPYAGYGDRVVLSVAADAPADVVAGAELVAGWYGFALRVCSAGSAGGTITAGPPDATEAAA